MTRMATVMLALTMIASKPITGQERYEPRLPSAGEIVDSVQLAGRLREFMAAHPVRRDRAILSMRYDTLGKLNTIHLVQPDVDQVTETALIQLVRQHTRDQAVDSTSVARPHLRLVLSTSDPNAMRTEPSTEQPPRLRNEARIRTRLQEYGTQLGVRGSVTFDVLVGVDGRPKRTRMHISSLNHAMDRVAMEIAKDMLFDPARIDGIPAEVWARIPIRLSSMPPQSP